MSLAIALFYGVLQGATELFPVSSLGHAVVVPPLLRLGVSQTDPSFLPFLVLLHLGTAAALVILYWTEWVRITRGFVRGALSGDISGPDERLAMLLVVATVPTGIIGFLLAKPLQALFAAPRTVAIFLIVNGGLLLGAELLRRRAERRAGITRRDASVEAGRFGSIDTMTVRSAMVIGASQILALLPGISRSGATMAAGLVAGLRHEEALRFSFLLATPIILAAGVLEVPNLAGAPDLGTYIVGALVAGLAAYASARFLVRYFRVGRLDPYAAYCALLGVTALIVIH
ncbi:MAG: undecaprenyl-diphosphate phosphatase [Candidatus Dormibacteria bacterium]